MFRKIFWIGIVCFVIALCYGTLRHFNVLARSSKEQPVSLTFRLAPTPPPFSLILAQTNSKSGASHLLNCPTTHCKLLVPPVGAIDPVTNGDSWYFYADQQDKKNGTIRVLKRQDINGKTQLISSQTPLVRPRDLFISPDGKKVAFWLDNTDDTSKNLTELWLYDSATGGAHVVAENVHIPDVITEPRWNVASTLLWMVANTAPANADQRLDLLVSTFDPPNIAAHFPKVDWSGKLSIANEGVMDVSADGNALAYGAPTQNSLSDLSITKGNQVTTHTQLRGSVPFLQWLEGGSLIYAVQDSRGFSFWRVQDGIHNYVTRQAGKLVAAHSDLQAQYVTFITSSLAGQQRFVLQLSTGAVTAVGTLPAFGDTLAITHVTQELLDVAGHVAGLTTVLDDGQLLNFIEDHFYEISQQKNRFAKRVIMTTQANTVFADYALSDGSLERLLVSVKDAVNPEWTVLARYTSIGADWQKVVGGGLLDPEPARLYEWENSVGKWIFKQDYTKR